MADRLAQLRKLAELSPEDPMTHYAVGLEFCNQERWTDAVTAFSNALRVDANYVPAYFHAGRALIRAGDRPAAADTLAQGIEKAREVGDSKTEAELRELWESVR